MLVPFDMLLSRAVRGDSLAGEAMDMLLRAQEQGIQTAVYSSRPGKSLTVKYLTKEESNA